MSFKIHIYHHGCLELDLLNAIHKLLNNMVTKENFDALRDEINSSLENLSGDITRLTDKLAAGGLTAQEEAQVFDEFREVADRIKSIADRTPEDPEPEV